MNIRTEGKCTEYTPYSILVLMTGTPAATHSWIYVCTYIRTKYRVGGMQQTGMQRSPIQHSDVGKSPAIGSLGLRQHISIMTYYIYDSCVIRSGPWC